MERRQWPPDVLNEACVFFICDDSTSAFKPWPAKPGPTASYASLYTAEAWLVALGRPCEPHIRLHLTPAVCWIHTCVVHIRILYSMETVRSHALRSLLSDAPRVPLR